MTHEIVPPHLAVQAMRDSGYKNAAYAIAELMDNSIQAGSSRVELLCAERVIQHTYRTISIIHQLAVLDNGSGMDSEVLRLALQFGNGLYLDPVRQTGMGRFGMGLPSSSISQCKRVDVYSWQGNADNAIHTYLDVDEIIAGKLVIVPEPKLSKIPDIWLKSGKFFEQTGTLVVWSNIDRCIWRTAGALIKNSEFLVGRLYRNFLNKNKVEIRMIAFDWDKPQNVSLRKVAIPNDPSYLMKNTSCPSPYDNIPMFEKFEEIIFDIEFRGGTHKVKVRFSHAKEEARRDDQAGRTPYGKHASNNVGISIVRAQRELDLDQSLVIQYDPRERWWGVEVEFPPALDELFGVANNKQAANNFAQLLKTDVESLLTGNKSIVELKAELMEEEDPRGPLIDIASKIRTQLNIIRRLLQVQTRGRRATSSRYDDQLAERVATQATRERQDKGHTGKSDADEILPTKEREEEIKRSLIDEGVSEATASELTARTLGIGLKYVWAQADLETPAFFSVKPRGGEVIITLNINHPAYSKLVEILQEDVEKIDHDTLKDRLVNARDGLKLLLMAWARYEDEQPDGARREYTQDARTDWGRIARDFLRDWV